MIFETLFFITLVVIICLLTMLANKIKIAYPILLVLAGLALSLVPGMPQIKVKGGARMDLYYLPSTLTLRSGL